jgi:hypothetical protein
MSEQNILNPTVGSDFNPDYGYSEGLPQMLSQFQAKSGKVIARQNLARGRVYDLQWQSRPKSTADALRTWEAQYRNDFFSYQDIERGRYFSGRFAGPPQISPAGFNKWNIQAQFVEIPGLPMFVYPASAALWTSSGGTDSIFLEERDGFGNEPGEAHRRRVEPWLSHRPGCADIAWCSRNIYLQRQRRVLPNMCITAMASACGEPNSSDRCKVGCLSGTGCSPRPSIFTPQRKPGSIIFSVGLTVRSYNRWACIG